MLNHVLPVLILARKKSNSLFLGQIVRFTHREITPKIFKCANYFSYNTKINTICHVNKQRTHAYIRILTIFSGIKLLFMSQLSGKGMAIICDTKVLYAHRMCLWWRGCSYFSSLQSCGLAGWSRADKKVNNGLTIASQRECNQRCWVDEKLSLLSLYYTSMVSVTRKYNLDCLIVMLGRCSIICHDVTFSTWNNLIY